MSRTISLMLVLLSLLAASAPSANERPGEGYKAFRYIRVRNIFDPSRRTDPAVEGSAPKPTSPAPAKPTFLALTGTMLRGEKPLGFFAGSSSELQRVVGAGETIGGYKIKALSLSGAELERDGQVTLLPVGRQLALEGSNAGQVAIFNPEPTAPASAPAASSLPGRPSPNAPAAGPSSDPPSTSGMPDSELIRRLKERRRQERKESK